MGKRMDRWFWRPGAWARMWGVLGAIMVMVLATWQGLHGEADWLACVAMLLCVILGEVVALRRYAEAHWDELHGPVHETLRGKVDFCAHDLKPGSTVAFDGKEFRVQQVTHEIATGERAGATTSFEATRGEDRP